VQLVDNSGRAHAQATGPRLQRGPLLSLSKKEFLTPRTYQSAITCLVWHQTNRQGISTELVEVAWLRSFGAGSRKFNGNNSRAILASAFIKIPRPMRA
jgi:hypothetical protein